MSFEVVNNFTQDVLKKLIGSRDSTSNVAFSGLVLYVSMGAINYGLIGRGFNKLSQLLQEDFEQNLDDERWEDTFSAGRWFYLQSRSMFEYHAKSSIFYPCPLSAHYERILSRKFGLDKTRIDLSNPAQSVIDINQWIHNNVQSETILDVVNESILSENKILFISTIFFHTEWQDKFELEHTGPELFYDDKGESIHVEMMNHISNYLMYIPPNNNWEILFKPFFESYVYAAIILPKKGSTVEHVINDIEFEKMFRYFQKAEHKPVKLKLPKFKIKTSKDFVPVFKNLGITDMFDDNHSDFGRMTNSSVSIGNIMQVINFSVEENGENIPNTQDVQQESHENLCEFCVNKPFIFVVYSDWNSLIYFSAVVNRPNAY